MTYTVNGYTHTASASPHTTTISKLGYEDFTDASYMFLNETYLTEVTSIPPTDNVTTMKGMFSGCTNLTSLDVVSGFNTSACTNMNSMFGLCRSLTSLDVSNFDVSNVTSTAYMFNGCSSLKELDLSNWNTSSKLTSITGMFQNCTSLEKLNLSNWFMNIKYSDSYATSECTALTEVDLSNSVIFYNEADNQLLNGCTNLKTLNLSNSRYTSHDSMGNLVSALYFNFNNIEKVIMNDSTCDEIIVMRNELYNSGKDHLSIIETNVECTVEPTTSVTYEDVYIDTAQYDYDGDGYVDPEAFPYPSNSYVYKHTTTTDEYGVKNYNFESIQIYNVTFSPSDYYIGTQYISTRTVTGTCLDQNNEPTATFTFEQGYKLVGELNDESVGFVKLYFKSPQYAPEEQILYFFEEKGVDDSSFFGGGGGSSVVPTKYYYLKTSDLNNLYMVENDYTTTYCYSNTFYFNDMQEIWYTFDTYGTTLYMGTYTYNLYSNGNLLWDPNDSYNKNCLFIL